MLLRRITQHIKNQNWFAVGLDVIVVIVGIFLGMQVTEWNEERQNRNLEKEYLVRLKANIHTDLEFYERLIKEATEEETAVDTLLEMLSDIEKASKSSESLIFSLRSLSFSRRISPITSTWNELVSSGRVGLIRETRIRERLGDYYEHFRLLHTGPVADMRDFNTFGKMVGEITTVNQHRAIYDRDQIWTEADSRGVLQRLQKRPDIIQMLSTLARNLLVKKRVLNTDIELAHCILNIMGEDYPCNRESEQ